MSLESTEPTFVPDPEYAGGERDTADDEHSSHGHVKHVIHQHDVVVPHPVAAPSLADQIDQVRTTFDAMLAEQAAIDKRIEDARAQFGALLGHPAVARPRLIVPPIPAPPMLAVVSRALGLEASPASAPARKTSKTAAKKSVAKSADRLPRRSLEDISNLAEKVRSLLLKNKDGLRSEAIRQELGVEKKELPRALAYGLENKSFTSKGDKRATTYYVK